MTIRGLGRGIGRGIGARSAAIRTVLLQSISGNIGVFGQSGSLEVPQGAPTALQTRILGMGAGTWSRHTTGETGITAAFIDTGADDSISAWANKGTWNPHDERFYFIGGDHDKAGGGGCAERLIHYDAASDAWVIRSSIFDSDPCNPGHPYDANALDWDNSPGYHYYKGEFRTPRWKTDTDSSLPGNWEDLEPEAPTGGRAATAMDFFRGKGMMMASNQNLLSKLDLTSSPTNRTWTTLSSSLAFAGEGICVYSPVLDILLFGGGVEGGNGQNHYKMNRAEAITGPFTPPAAIGDLNNHGDSSNYTIADPITGEFIIVTPDFAGNVEVWKYDGTTFTQLADAPFPASNNNAQARSVIFPCNSYGAVVYAKHVSDGTWQMWVYRHAIAFLPTVTDEVT